MAIDKNSKAYQSLLNSGYTDEQITQMHGAVNSGQSAKEVVANTPKSTAPTVSDNQSTITKNTVNGNLSAGSNATSGGTPVKQQETVGNTVSEIKQQGQLKPLSQEYYNQTSDEAQNQIRANLNGYRQSNPELFSTYEDFKKNFSYDARDEVQKNTLDNWYKGYEKGLQLSGISVSDLYNQYKNGQISSSDLEVLRNYNPEKYAQLQNQINKGSIIAAYDDDKGVDTTGMSLQDMAYQSAATLMGQLMNGGNSTGASMYFQEYKDNMNSPEMMELSDKTTEVEEQIKNIQDQISSMTKDVEAEYEGTGATKSKINAIVADRTYDLQQQLRTLNNEYEKYAMQYNNRMQQYQQEFQLQLQEYQLGMQERNQKMSELGFALDLMNFETNEQKQQREWDYWVMQQEYTNGNINSSDYQTRYKAALKSVQNLLAQYEGIPMKRSAEQMAQDILTAIDNGSDLGTELTKLNTLIQDKPEYKKLYNQAFGEIETKGFGNAVSIGGVDYIEYDGKLYTSDEFNKKFGGKAKPYNQVSEDALKVYSDGRRGTYGYFVSQEQNSKGKVGGQCGKFVNDYLQEIGVGRYYDDDLETKINSINSYTPKIGTIAVFDYDYKSSDGINHGHVGIVTDILKDGRIVVTDSNYKGDEKINYRIINPKDTRLKGYFDPTLPPGTTSNSVSNTTTTTTNGTTTTTTSTVETEPDGMIHLGSTKLTPTQFDDYVKKYIDGTVSYSEVKSLGDDALNKVTERSLQLAEEGYTPSTKITDPNKQASLESSLRKEYDKLTEDANATINWVQKMDDAYSQVDNNLNAASQALVIAYNKILDESSVVREGEYARTSEGQSLLDQMDAKVKQLAKGGAGITKAQLKSLINMAHTFSKNAENYRNEMANRAKVSIEKYGLTPEAVLPLSVINQDTTETEENWQDGLNKSSDVFKPTTNIGGKTAPANFYQS